MFPDFQLFAEGLCSLEAYELLLSQLDFVCDFKDSLRLLCYKVQDGLGPFELVVLVLAKERAV